MKNKLTIKKCNNCGATIEVLKDCTCDDCGIQCCGEEMLELESNTFDASIEKHKPTYEIVDSYIVANVAHIMEDEHYIEWIALDSDKINAKKYFKPNDIPKAVFPYIKGSKIYAYCNKHGLWSTEIE